MIEWPGLADDLGELVAMVERLAGDVITPAAGHLDEHGEVPADVHAALRQTGLWSLGLPEAVGGGGADLLAVTIAVAELSAASPTVGVLVAASSLAATTDPELTGALSAVAAGGLLAVADSRSPLVSWDRSGPTVTLSSSRVECAEAACAALLIGEDEAWMIGPDLWRARLYGPPVRCTGLHGLDARPVAWSGEPAQLASLGPAALRARWYLLLAATACGVTGAAVEQVAQYVSQRHQFGRPLLSFGHVAAQVAALQAAAAGSARAVHSLAVELSAASASAAKRAAVVAIATTQAAIQVTGDVIQLHGGYGYIADYPCERWFRDCVSLRAVLSASLPGRPRPPASAYPQLAGTTAAS